MYYGIVTQTDGSYTEHQLRAYPLRIQRTQDGAAPVPAARVKTGLRHQLRTPHIASVHAGGVVITIISKSEASDLLA